MPFKSHVAGLILTVSLTSSKIARCADVALSPSPPGENNSGPQNPLNTFAFHLSEIIIGFGLAVLIGQFLMLRRVGQLTGDDIARNCAITIVVTAALVLVIAGYSSSQIAPAFGLFGTIVGYLLGRSHGQMDDISKARANAAHLATHDDVERGSKE